MPGSLVVLSTREQVQTYRDDPDLKDAHVFCDNEALFSDLEQAKIPFQQINEFLIRPHWTALNAWGCGRSALWLERARTLTPPGVPDVLPGIHLYFSCFLIAAAKNRAYAVAMIEKVRPSRVCVFEDRAHPVYPDYSGNAFLNYFLEEVARSRGIEISRLSLNPPPTNAPGRASFFRAIARRFYGNGMSLWLSLTQKKRHDKYFIVYGALRHLETTIQFLHERGIPILIYDHDFHREIHRFAALRKIPYVTSGQLPTPSEAMISQNAAALMRQFKAKFDLARRERIFEYEGYDYAGMLEAKVLNTMETYFRRTAAEWYRCGQLLKKYRASGCLLEEDFGVRANFGEFFKFSGVPNFCISHGHGGFDFDPVKEGQTFWQSTTFVNSEHEKLKMYISRGWDGEGIVVSGTPRYDQLFQKLKARQLPPLPKRILYCAGSLSASSPDTPGYLGIDMVAYRSFQVKAFRQFLEAAEGLPLSIMVKSHYDSDDRPWEELLKASATRCEVKIYKHSEDFHDLLIRSHAMILPCLSTSLIEAALCRIPVIFLDLNDQRSPSVLDFSNHGLCAYADSVARIRQELERIVAADPLRADTRRDPADAYFLGNNFGCATQATGEIILRCLQQPSPTDQGGLGRHDPTGAVVP